MVMLAFAPAFAPGAPVSNAPTASSANELRPGRLGERVAKGRVGSREPPMKMRVVDSLIVGQVQVERDHIEAGQEPTRQVADRKLVDGRPDEVRQASEFSIPSGPAAVPG